MGCTLSHIKRNSNENKDIFKVYNINDAGQNCFQGKIELTPTSLIHHQQGKQPINWPLTCLRRYGYQDNLFTFESGRCCTTGSGIFAFRSSHADRIFFRLQHNLALDAVEAVNQETFVNREVNNERNITTNSHFLHPNRANISLNDYHNLMTNPHFHNSNDMSPLSPNAPSVYENQPCLTLASLPDLLAHPSTNINRILNSPNSPNLINLGSIHNTNNQCSNTYLNVVNHSPASASSSPSGLAYINFDKVNYTRIFFPEDNHSPSYANDSDLFRRQNSDRTRENLNGWNVEDSSEENNVLKYTTIDIDKTVALNHMSNYTNSKRNRQTSP